MAPTAPKLIFGVAGIKQWTPEVTKEMIKVLDSYNVVDLDTAYIYADSEKLLKENGISSDSKFIIHSKAPGFQKGSLSKQSILDGMAETLNRLGVDHVETYYFHAPDDSVPLAESLSAITQLYKEGKFRHFGLSNFTAAQVQEIYDIQSSSNAVLPTVFQGNYNAASRHIEGDLFPLLKKLKIAFYAYSPIAGGFLVKTSQQFQDNSIESGRFSGAARAIPVGQMYSSMYGKPSLLAALDEWEEIAKAEGISKAALAYRWIAFHSAIQGPEDGIILGASKPEQLKESLAAIQKGPLSAESAKKIDGVWEKIKADAPLDNYHSHAKEHGV